MKVLREIYYRPGLRLDGITVQRTAVRGIIMAGARLLMIYSTVNTDYKFPGGGVEPGETLQQALIREVREECGTADVTVLDAFGTMIEYDQPKETDCDLFCMTSHYFLCQVGATVNAQVLDDYEQALGFTPRWIEAQAALENNRRLLASNMLRPRWVTRDTHILELICQNMTLGVDNHHKSSYNT